MTKRSVRRPRVLFFTEVEFDRHDDVMIISLCLNAECDGFGPGQRQFFLYRTSDMPFDLYSDRCIF